MTPTTPWRRAVLIPVVLGFVLTASSVADVTVVELPESGAVIPDQYIAKLYSEGLGRIPDTGAWANATDFFATSGCNHLSLATLGRDVYISPEFTGKPYDNAARLLTLYRGVLNREPDETTFNLILPLLEDGSVTWQQVVEGVLRSQAFVALIPQICSSSLPNYGFGTQAVLELEVTTSGFAGGSGAELQALLDDAAAGETVWLAQKAVVLLDDVLTIPKNVTLATTDLPRASQYALMGRLVRNASFDGPAVKLRNGAKLDSVWVDGQRSQFGFFNHLSINAQLFGGDGTSVTDCRFSNTMGWSTVQALGSAEGWSCAGATLTGNLITVYTSDHYDGTWADGLSVACENSLVADNHVIDATDVPIVLFRASPAVQQSEVRDNKVLNAGNSSYGGLVVDGLHSLGQQHDFTGASVHDNLLWTGSSVHYDIALSVGTRAWFGHTSDIGTGASVSDNTTGGLLTRVDAGIGVSGMLDTFVQGNDLLVTQVEVSACPTVNVGASVTAGYASGSIQPYTDLLIEGCIGHGANVTRPTDLGPIVP